MGRRRLSKVLAAAGVASRRACEQLIFEGRVHVNQKLILIPQFEVSESDLLTVDHKPVQQQQEKVYYLLNKPSGYICTSKRSNSQSKIVLDLFDGVAARLFTIGRLDKETEGLLLVTNDGHFGQRVIHPSFNIQKEYLVKTDREITHEHLVAMSEGTFIEGILIKPKKVTKVRGGTLKVVVTDGKKREVRHLVEGVGLQIRELTRVRIGNLLLGKLPPGSWRLLTEREKALIFE